MFFKESNEQPIHFPYLNQQMYPLSFHQIDAVKEKLRASEKQADVNLELVSTKEAQFKKEVWNIILLRLKWWLDFSIISNISDFN